MHDYGTFLCFNALHCYTAVFLPRSLSVDSWQHAEVREQWCCYQSRHLGTRKCDVLSNTYKNWPVCGFGLWNTFFLASCYSNALHYYKMWVTCDDFITSSIFIQNVFYSMKLWRKLASNYWSKVQKSQVLLCGMLHPPPTPIPPLTVSRQPSFKLTSPSMLPSTKVSTGSSACTKWITKSHSSPIHVNETQALLSASKALLSADSYLSTRSLRARLQWGYKSTISSCSTCLSMYWTDGVLEMFK